MRNIIKSLTAVFIATAMLTTNVFAANPASFTLSPSASSIVKGSTFSVSVYENGTNVNAVTTKLTFNSAQLQLNGTSCGSSFSSSIAETNGQTCFTAGGTVVNGSVVALNATFTALTDSGSTTISIASGSKIVSSDSNTNIWSGAPTSTSVTLTTPPTPPTQPTPPTGGSGSTDGTSSPSSSTSGSTTNTTKSASSGAPSDSTTDIAAATTNDSTGAVKGISATKTAATIVPNQTNDTTKKTLLTILPPLLAALVVVIVLTYPVIIADLKKAKITNFVRQQFAKIASK